MHRAGLIAMAVLVSCSNSPAEPPPPATSATVAVAPPGAQGAYAAGAVAPRRVAPPPGQGGAGPEWEVPGSEGEEDAGVVL